MVVVDFVGVEVLFDCCRIRQKQGVLRTEVDDEGVVDVAHYLGIG